MNIRTNNPIEQLRASLADEPDAWSRPLRLLAEALLAHCDEKSTIDIVRAADVPFGSVVQHAPTDCGNTVTVRFWEGSGWHCEGGDVGCGWDWEVCGFEHGEVLASGLTGRECRLVAGFPADVARAWCEGKKMREQSA